MKVVSRSTQRINIFWNYSLDKITISTQSDIKILAEYRERLLQMIDQEKLTKDEYNEFRKLIGKVNIAKFVDCIFISDLIFDIPRKELLDEVKKLSESGFLASNLKDCSEISQIFYLINELQNKLLSTANNLTRQNEPDNIEYLQNILASFNGEGQEYLKMLDEFYIEWVEKTFSAEGIKVVMLANKAFFKSEVKKFAIMALNRAYDSKNISEIYKKERFYGYVKNKYN